MESGLCCVISILQNQCHLPSWFSCKLHETPIKIKQNKTKNNHFLNLYYMPSLKGTNPEQKLRNQEEQVSKNVSDTWQEAENLLIPAADSRTHFHNWGLKGQRKWVGIVLSWLVIRMVLLSISFIHSYNYKWGPLCAYDLFLHTRRKTKNTHI